MAAEGAIIGAAVRVIVSEPWEFETEVGTSTLVGRVSAVDADAVVIDLDVAVAYEGTTFGAARATARYEGEQALDAGARDVVCNLELSGGDVPAYLIGTLRVC
jgi:hypothetical protein